MAWLEEGMALRAGDPVAAVNGMNLHGERGHRTSQETTHPPLTAPWCEDFSAVRPARRTSLHHGSPGGQPEDGTPTGRRGPRRLKPIVPRAPGPAGRGSRKESPSDRRAVGVFAKRRSLCRPNSADLARRQRVTRCPRAIHRRLGLARLPFFHFATNESHLVRRHAFHLPCHPRFRAVDKLQDRDVLPGLNVLHRQRPAHGTGRKLVVRNGDHRGLGLLVQGRAARLHGRASRGHERDEERHRNRTHRFTCGRTGSGENNAVPPATKRSRPPRPPRRQEPPHVCIRRLVVA